MAKRKTKKPEKLSVAVLGAGHGGLAMAGHLALMGIETYIYTRNNERITAIQNRGGIEVRGVVEGFGAVHATHDLKECIEERDLIMVAVPAMGHRYYAEQCAPYFQDKQVVILNPGRTGGALEFANILKKKKCNAKILLAETQTFIYVSRHTELTEAHIFDIKNSVALAALPAYKTPKVLEIVNRVFPQFIPATNVLETSFDNIGAIFHPGITILNCARIEDEKSNFEFYIEGVSPTMSKILEAMDKERIEIAKQLGIRTHSAREWLYLSYDTPGKTLYDAIMGTPGYKGVLAPRTLQHRYIYEDVPFSLVPMESLGKQLKIETPIISAMITLANTLMGTDFRKEGRTVESMGLENKTLLQIRRMVVAGPKGELKE